MTPLVNSVSLHKALTTASLTLNVDKSIQPQYSHFWAKSLTAAQQSDKTLEVPGTAEKFNKTLEVPETKRLKIDPKRLMNAFIDAAFSQLNLKF